MNIHPAFLYEFSVKTSGNLLRLNSFFSIIKCNFNQGVFYLMNIIIPELVYTMLVTIVLYMILLKINQRLELIEKRSAKKFV